MTGGKGHNIANDKTSSTAFTLNNNLMTRT